MTDYDRDISYDITRRICSLLTDLCLGPAWGAASDPKRSYAIEDKNVYSMVVRKSLMH